ncbi:hypothetical protein GCM10010358_27190 [Streptomyces minutiscleroticus]|uniref:Uncharacterized protein n=1 Tax=Streptomyces minutiscleroticus TaxID=68238 RepID=A0A918KP94_9ACTN|nr:hypothetical protein GCM10010358_27190 [Streptomyces minutiscleroticus]
MPTEQAVVVRGGGDDADTGTGTGTGTGRRTHQPPVATVTDVSWSGGRAVTESPVPDGTVTTGTLRASRAVPRVSRLPPGPTSRAAPAERLYRTTPYHFLIESRITC